MRATNKGLLIKGSVKPWHVVFLCAVVYSVAIVASYKFTVAEPLAYRMALRDIASTAITGTLLVLLVVVVPEFRKTIPILFARPVRRPHLADMALALAVMIAWLYGLYMLLARSVAILWHVDLLPVMRLGQAPPPLEWKHLVFFLGAVLLAPIAEELMFRGYLLNLWAARWGVIVAVILSSITFGAFHLERAIFAGVMGIAFAAVYLRYDSLWPGIALHATFNFLAFPWLLPRVFVLDRAHSQDVATWIPDIVLAVLFVFLAALFWRRFKPAVA